MKPNQIDTSQASCYKISRHNFNGCLKGLKGKPVKIRRGPAAVIGDESRMMPLPFRMTVGRRGK